MHDEAASIFEMGRGLRQYLDDVKSADSGRRKIDFAITFIMLYSSLAQVTLRLARFRLLPRPLRLFIVLPHIAQHFADDDGAPRLIMPAPPASLRLIVASIKLCFVFADIKYY